MSKRTAAALSAGNDNSAGASASSSSVGSDSSSAGKSEDGSGAGSAVAQGKETAGQHAKRRRNLQQTRITSFSYNPVTVSSATEVSARNVERHSARSVITPDLSKLVGFRYVTDVFPKELCTQWYRELEALPDWQFHQIMVGGKLCTPRRMTCAFSNDGVFEYHYGGTSQLTRPIKNCPPIQAIVDAIETLFVNEQPGVPRINYVLLNYYKDGTHSLGMHADSERDLIGPVYGVCLNEAGDDLSQRRFFDITETATGNKVRLPMDNGSVMIMHSTFQKLYKHGVPAQLTVRTGRINLTLRTVRPPSPPPPKSK